MTFLAKGQCFKGIFLNVVTCMCPPPPPPPVVVVGGGGGGGAAAVPGCGKVLIEVVIKRSIRCVVHVLPDVVVTIVKWELM